jgi:hypothetical protein
MWVGDQRHAPVALPSERRPGWNVMEHAQKPDFVFRQNGPVYLNRQRRQFSRLLAGEVCASAVVMLDSPCSKVVWRVLATVQSTTGRQGVRICGSNARFTVFQGSVKSTGYPLHSPFSPSLPLPCVTVCHHISTGVCSWYRRLREPQGRSGRVQKTVDR